MFPMSTRGAELCVSQGHKDESDPEEWVNYYCSLADFLWKKKINFIVGINDFDERLRQGDPALVTLIAKNNGNINLFSFASKYCTFHAVDVYGLDDYVIYDRVVKDALPKYVAGLKKTTIEAWRQSYDYIAYKKCIDDLLDANGINIPFRHRKLDHYLWNTYR